MSKKKAAVVLAAGKGKRMKSDLPKVLHTINGRPMISIVLDRLAELSIDKTVVVIGYKGEMVEQTLSDREVEFVWQREQLGTGHAVMMAREKLADFDGTTLIALGDMPFVTTESYQRLFETHLRTGAAATCLSALLDDPAGYGRIVRVPDTDLLKKIVEHRDADEATLKIREINTGAFCFENQRLFEILDQIGNDNDQNEYYLTDTIEILHGAGEKVAVVTTGNPDEGLGINSVDQLERLTRRFNEKA